MRIGKPDAATISMIKLMYIMELITFKHSYSYFHWADFNLEEGRENEENKLLSL